MLLNIAEQPKRNNRISLTPLIDVVFILLLFFMLSSTFTRWYQLDLPVPVVNESQTPDIKVLTVLSNDGDIKLDTGIVNLADLQQLQRLVEDNANAVLVVNAKQGVSVQTLIRTLDAIKKVGGQHVSFAGLAQ